MKHWTPQDVEDYLERRRVYLHDAAAFPLIAEMLNRQILKADEPIPGRLGSSADDCIVHWTHRGKAEMEAWSLLAP
jgi:hypothetical protein